MKKGFKIVLIAFIALLVTISGVFLYKYSNKSNQNSNDSIVSKTVQHKHYALKAETLKENINGHAFEVKSGTFKNDIKNNTFYFNDEKIEGSNISFKLIGDYTNINSEKVDDLYLVKDDSAANSYYLINYSGQVTQDEIISNAVTGKVQKATNDGIYLEDGKLYSIKKLKNISFCEDNKKHAYNPKDFPANTLVSIIIPKNSKEPSSVIRFMTIINN